MIDWMASETTEEREAGYSGCVLTCVIDWHPQFNVTFVHVEESIIHCGECVRAIPVIIDWHLRLHAVEKYQLDRLASQTVKVL